MRWAILLLFAFAVYGQTISTLIGDGTRGFDDRRVNNPYGLVIGPDKALYFCDIDNHAIRRVDLQTGTVTTVVGTGAKGNSGDGGKATDALVDQPYEVRFDSKGNLFFVDMLNHVVRRVDKKSGLISTVAGTGKPGFSGDGGSATLAQFNQPHSIEFDREGRLLICDIGNHRVRRIDMKSGKVDTFLGTGEQKPTPDGPAKGAPFNGPRAIAFDRVGNLYLALREGNTIHKVDAKGNVTRVAGRGSKGLKGDGGPALSALLNGPKGIAVSKDGLLFVADTENHAIRKIDLKSGMIATVAGTGEKGDGPEGDPSKCRMNRPHGIFVDNTGVVYIGDSEAHRVRKLE
jgi:sugar lactone lactonase YvrE